MRHLVLLPLGMVAFNAVFFTLGLMFEGRIKPNVARYGLMYLLCIPSAWRGDLEPFVRIFCMPPVG